MPSSFFRNTLLLGIGLVSVTAEKVEGIVDELIKKGEVSESEKSKMIKDLLNKAESTSKELREKIENVVKEKIDKFNFASQKEIDLLKEKIAELEKQIEELKNKEF